MGCVQSEFDSRRPDSLDGLVRWPAGARQTIPACRQAGTVSVVCTILVGMHEGPEEIATRHSFWNTLGEIARKLLRKDEPDPRNFADAFSAEEIERDLSALERRERSFQGEDSLQKEFHAMADVLEAIVCQQGSLNSWFGDDAEVVKTSRFDDVMRGVDAVIEFAPTEGHERAEHLALAVDITFNEDTEQAKLRKILGFIDRGDVVQIKYFDSEYAHGPITAPEVILGIERKHVTQLAETWAEGMDEHNIKKLAAHPVRDLLAIQALDQCAAFAAYAALKGNTEAEVAYSRAGSLLQQSLEHSGWKRKPVDARFSDDEVHHKIIHALTKLPHKERVAPRRRIIVDQPKSSNV